MADLYGTERLAGLAAPRSEQEGFRVRVELDNLGYPRSFGTTLQQANVASIATQGDWFFNTETGRFQVYAGASAWDGIAGIGSLFDRTGAVVPAFRDYDVYDFTSLIVDIVGLKTAKVEEHKEATSASVNAELHALGGGVVGWYDELLAGDGADQTGIADPYTGQKFYRTDVNGAIVYDGSAWQSRLPAPTARLLSPEDGASGFAGSTTRVTFKHAVAEGSGDWALYDSGGLVETIAAGDCNYPAANTVEIPWTTITTGNSYYVLADSGVVTNIPGVPWAGLSDPADWNWSTIVAAAFGGSDTSVDTDGSGMTIALPSNSEGDRLVVFASQYYSGSGGGDEEAPASGTLVSGYSLEAEDFRNHTASFSWAGLYTKLAGASESDPTATWDNEGSGPRNSVIANAITNAGRISVLTPTYGADASPPATVAPPSVGACKAGDIALYYAHCNAATGTPPTFSAEGGDAENDTSAEAINGWVLSAYEEVGADGAPTAPTWAASHGGAAVWWCAFAARISPLASAAFLIDADTTSSVNTDSPVTFTLPSHAEGDTLIVFATQASSGAGGGTTEAPVGGTLVSSYTLQAEELAGDVGVWAGVFTKTAGASESDPTGTWDNEGTPGTPDYGSIAMAVRSGATITVTSTTYIGGAGTAAPPSPGACNDGDIVLYLAVGNDTSGVIFDADGGNAVESVNVTPTIISEMRSAYEEVTADGTPTPPIWTYQYDGTELTAAFTVRIQPA